VSRESVQIEFGLQRPEQGQYPSDFNPLGLVEEAAEAMVTEIVRLRAELALRPAPQKRVLKIREHKGVTYHTGRWWFDHTAYQNPYKLIYWNDTVFSRDDLGLLQELAIIPLELESA
jgi:hypothetical protein